MYVLGADRILVRRRTQKKVIREYSAAKRLRVPCWGRFQANKKAKAALAFFYSLQSARKQAWPRLSVIKKPPFRRLFVCLAESEGFEPSIPLRGIHTFQACAFDHSANSPFKGGAKYGIYRLISPHIGRANPSRISSALSPRPCKCMSLAQAASSRMSLPLTMPKPSSASLVPYSPC